MFIINYKIRLWIINMGLEAIIKGWTGELKTKFIQSIFLGESYHVFNNVLIKTERGTTQIDHVIVSKYGIFSVETKDKTGWIFGSEKQHQWTQKIFNKTYRFQNPLIQNYGHTKSLSEFLGVEHNNIHSIVIFWGDCEFKTKMPNNVFKGGIFGGEFKNFIRGKTAILFSPDEVNRVCGELVKAKENSGFFSGLKHVNEVRNKYNSNTICPKCGADLVRRMVSRGTNSGKYFIGCSNYPRCKYTREQ